MSHFSLKHWLLMGSGAFVVVSLLIALGVWTFLNTSASLDSGYSKLQLELPASVQTRTQTHGGQESNMTGSMNALIPLEGPLKTGLYDTYAVRLKFKTKIPLDVRIDYDSEIEINQVVPIEATTKLINEGKWIPDVPLRLNLPVNIKVPFSLHETYSVVAEVDYDADTWYRFNESFTVPLDQIIEVPLQIEDRLKIVALGPLEARLHSGPPLLNASMDLSVHVPLKNARPTEAAQ